VEGHDIDDSQAVKYFSGTTVDCLHNIHQVALRSGHNQNCRTVSGQIFLMLSCDRCRRKALSQVAALKVKVK